MAKESSLKRLSIHNVSKFNKSDELVAVAQSILDGSLPILSGLRLLVSLREDVDGFPAEVFRPLIAIDDETQHYPLGDVRNRWNPAALSRMDVELDRYLNEARPRILAACEEIIQSYASRH